GRFSATVATRHVNGAGCFNLPPWRARAPAPAVGEAAASAALVAPIPLFLPRITAVVVAVGLPEPGLVVVEELQPANPLGALPEVEVRDEQPGGTTVHRLERLAVGFVPHPSRAPGHGGRRGVRE